jgi:hypothetical protein
VKAIITEEEIVAGPGGQGTEWRLGVPAPSADTEADTEPGIAGLVRSLADGEADDPARGVRPGTDLAVDTGPLTAPIAIGPDLGADQMVATEVPGLPVLPGSARLQAVGHGAGAWARGRSLRPGSACGVALGCGLCAAAWFTAGSRSDDIKGMIALSVGYFVVLSGRGLASAVEPAERAAAGWLLAVSWWVPECAVYAGLAIGARADGSARVWPLAIAVLGLAGVRDIMTACCGPPRQAGQAAQAAGRTSTADGTSTEGGIGPGRRALSLLARMPAGGRVLLVCVVAPAWGPRATLLTLLAWAVIAVACGFAGHGPASSGGRPLDGSPRDPSLARVLLLRDDGVLARQAGKLVRGNLLPLPPAILGLLAVSALAVLGLHNLPGVLALGPALVMLLAAPGSSSDHAGRFDWLAPVLLIAAQVVYIGALGTLGPVSFVLCAALMLRYLGLAWPGRPPAPARKRPWPTDPPAGRGPWLGWEGRLLLIGLAAAIGITTFAYLALTAYLGVLVGANILTSCMALGEDDGSDRRGSGGRS